MMKFLQNVFFKSGLKNLRIVPSPDLRKKRGFSLIELLVGMTIGAIILTVVMGSYAAMAKTTMRLDLARQLQKETNFAVIRMADKIRNFPIESCAENKLVLDGRDKGQLTFEFLLENKKQLTLNEQPLFSANLQVKEGKFECVGVEDSAEQPRVQIYLLVSAKKEPEITSRVQTTISSRIF